MGLHPIHVRLGYAAGSFFNRLQFHYGIAILRNHHTLAIQGAFDQFRQAVPRLSDSVRSHVA